MTFWVARAIHRSHLATVFVQHWNTYLIHNGWYGARKTHLHCFNATCQKVLLANSLSVISLAHCGCVFLLLFHSFQVASHTTSAWGDLKAAVTMNIIEKLQWTFHVNPNTCSMWGTWKCSSLCSVHRNCSYDEQPLGGVYCTNRKESKPTCSIFFWWVHWHSINFYGYLFNNISENLWHVFNKIYDILQ